MPGCRNIQNNPAYLCCLFETDHLLLLWAHSLKGLSAKVNETLLFFGLCCVPINLRSDLFQPHACFSLQQSDLKITCVDLRASVRSLQRERTRSTCCWVARPAAASWPPPARCSSLCTSSERTTARRTCPHSSSAVPTSPPGAWRPAPSETAARPERSRTAEPQKKKMANFRTVCAFCQLLFSDHPAN